MTSGLIGRIVLAVIVAIVVGLLLVLLGGILVTLKVPIAVTIGDFFRDYGFVIGVLAGLWFFFGGGNVLRAP